MSTSFPLPRDRLPWVRITKGSGAIKRGSSKYRVGSKILTSWIARSPYSTIAELTDIRPSIESVRAGSVINEKGMGAKSSGETRSARNSNLVSCIL